MEHDERVEEVLQETEILKFPDKLISSSQKTTLKYYVLAVPYYHQVFKNEEPETKIREGQITWDKPKLLTPEYILKMEGFSNTAREVLKMLARRNPDLAGLLYKLKYVKDYEEATVVSRDIDQTYEMLVDDIEEAGDVNTTAIIKGIDEYWDVSLMKFVQELMLKSAVSSQMSDYSSKGYITSDDSGYPVVTRNLEGLPLAAREDIEQMFTDVRSGDLDPSNLKQELDRWGVYRQYEDRFLDLFRRG